MRSLFVSFFLLLSLGSMAQQQYLFIGTYTHTGSKGIYVYRFDAATGKAEWVSNTEGIVNPSYLALSADGNNVYAVNETGGENGGKVSAFTFDKKKGTLQLLSQQPAGGDAPCYIAVTKNKDWVVVGNYTGGNFSALPISKDGSLQPPVQTVQHKGSSLNKDRQTAPHVHATVFSPDEKYLYAPDLGIDKVMVYLFDAGKEKRPVKAHRQPFAEVTPGGGPRHFTFHPNKKWAYLIEELSGYVVAFKYNKGKLQQVQRMAAHHAGSTAKKGSADIHVSPDGNFLYASNRGEENNIAIFKIDAKTGALTAVGYQPVNGESPRNFVIDPSGNYLLVANQNTDNVVVFKRDRQTGLLQATGLELKLPKPVCLKLMPVE